MGGFSLLRECELLYMHQVGIGMTMIIGHALGNQFALHIDFTKVTRNKDIINSINGSGMYSLLMLSPS